MDRETQQRLAQAKRELAEVLRSLQGGVRTDDDHHGQVVVFTGNVTITRFVQYTPQGLQTCE